MRGLAALLLNSLDEFLREMQHITDSTNTQHKYSSPISPRNDRIKNNNTLTEVNHHQEKTSLLHLLRKESYQRRMFQTQEKEARS